MAKGTPSYDVHADTACATIVSHSGVPAASASVRLSKAPSTCCRCPSVSARPWRRSRCINTIAGSEIVSTPTTWLCVTLCMMPSSFPFNKVRHWNSG